MTSAAEKRCFVLCHNLLGVSRDDILLFLNTRPEILNYYAVLPGHILLISYYGVNDLTALLRAKFPREFFFLAEIAPQTVNGFLRHRIWEFINNPHRSGC